MLEAKFNGSFQWNLEDRHVGRHTDIRYLAHEFTQEIRALSGTRIRYV